MGYRYIGAKSRLLGEVLSEINRIVPPGSTVADIMCGTATVSAALRQAGYNVIANDVMTYSFHHARVALLISSPPDFSMASEFIVENEGIESRTPFPPVAPYEEILNKLNRVKPMKGYFYREFSPSGAPKSGNPPRQYFTPDNAMKIDGIRAAIASLSNNGDVTDLEYSLLVHDLIMAANDVANIAGTYGHYLSRFIGRAKDTLHLYPTQFMKVVDEGNHNILQGYAEELASQINCDLCYIDPPYIKRQYAANYHILETLARGDEPDAIGVSGLRPWRDQYSDFCTKTKIRTALKRVVSKMRCSNFLISYSEDGLLTIPELTKVLTDFGNVTINHFTNKRFKSNPNDSKPTHPRIFDSIEDVLIKSILLVIFHDHLVVFCFPCNFVFFSIDMDAK